jgi:glucuronate isomerase
LVFKAGDKKGIWLARLLRRWASSEYAFRQRQRNLSNAEKRAFASWVEDSDPKLARILKKKPWLVQCHVEVKPEDRKSWKPKDAGRDKGFSVRNSAKVAQELINFISHKSETII